MSRENKGKRPIALPVVLLLLVFSVTGNVLFSTKNIQHGQDKLEIKGRIIFQAVENSFNHAKYMAEWTASLQGETANSPDQARIKASTAAGFLPDADAFQELLSLAEEKNAADNQLTGSKESAAVYLSKAVDGLQQIGKGSGQLTEEEVQFIASLHKLYQAVYEKYDKFPFAAGAYSSSLIRFANGMEWIEVTAEVQKQLDSFMPQQ